MRWRRRSAHRILTLPAWQFWAAWATGTATFWTDWAAAASPRCPPVAPPFWWARRGGRAIGTGAARATSSAATAGAGITWSIPGAGVFGCCWAVAAPSSLSRWSPTSRWFCKGRRLGRRSPLVTAALRAWCSCGWCRCASSALPSSSGLPLEILPALSGCWINCFAGRSAAFAAEIALVGET